MSITSQPKCCPKCGGPIPAEAPQGLCPRCLLLQASLPTEAGRGASAKSAPPTHEELAAAFPQLEILELIGQGGMGFVFKARQPKLDRFVALKILPASLAADPAFAERFTREGRMLARLNHPNIVAIHDFGQANGFFYLLMEFVDGVNLRQAMKVGRFTPAQALAVVPKICEALQFAHNEGILHRDIKPENILLDSKGRVKIADFGIAKLVEGADLLLGQPGTAGPAPAPNLTETGKALGTPQYMAPEQLEHPQDVDQRADIYSLGVVFYEMLTGELPLGRFAPPSEKSAVDPRVDEVVLRTLEKERERRTQTAGEVRTQVETIAATPELSNSRREEEAETGSGKRKQVWWTWWGFQSPQAGQICAHLAKEERRHLSVLGLLYALWVMITVFGIPALNRTVSNPGDWILTAVWAGLFIVSLPMIDRMMRHFLCSTEWARRQGFKPERLRLFSFASGKITLAVLAVLVVLVLALETLETFMIHWPDYRSQQPAVRERQQTGAARSTAPTPAQPGKTLVLRNATNAAQNILLETASALLAGETLVTLTELPDGRMETNPAGLYIIHRPDGTRVVPSFRWSLPEYFGAHEDESVVLQLRRNIAKGPILLNPGEPLRLFSVTNQFGDALSGYLEFRRFEARPPGDSTGPEARIHGSVTLKPPISFLLSRVWFSASVPPGYIIQATASPSRLESTSFNSKDLAWCYASWSSPEAFHGTLLKDTTRQLEQLAKQGPIQVYLGEPRQVFAVTNEAGEVYRGFFELVGPPAAAGPPDHLALAGESSATVPSLAPPAPEAKFIMDTVQFDRAHPEPGELFWGFKCFVPPGHLASILFVRWTNGVPQVDPGFSGYFKVGEAGGIDIPFCSLACYRIVETAFWKALNEYQRREAPAGWKYPESSSVTNAVRWDVNIGLGFTASCWKEMPPYRGVKLQLPQSLRSGHQRAIRLLDFDTLEADANHGQSGVELRIFLEPLKSPPVRMVPNEVEQTNYIAGKGLAGTMEDALRAIKEWPTDP
jgi:serine/threonine protein kinase